MIRHLSVVPTIPSSFSSDAYGPGPSLHEVAFHGARLERGDAGEGVRAMQSLLNMLGAQPPLDEDGLFGPKTQAALGNFQGGAGFDTQDPPGACGLMSLVAMLMSAGMNPNGSPMPRAPMPSAQMPGVQMPGVQMPGAQMPGPMPSLRPVDSYDGLSQNTQRAPMFDPKTQTPTQTPTQPPAQQPTGDLSHMADWARGEVGKKYVYGTNDCVTMCQKYIKELGLTPGKGSNNHDILPPALDFMGGFDASSGKLREMPGIGKNHQDIQVGSIFGIGELCNQSDCRALGHAPDGTKFNTLFSCSHSGIISSIKREGDRPDGRIVDFGFSEMHGSVKGGGPGMTFHDSFVNWANQSRSHPSQFQHAFVYQPPGTNAPANTQANPQANTQANTQTNAGPSTDRKQIIDAVWNRESNKSFNGLVEWDPTEKFPSLGAFHTTWDNPNHPGEGGGGNSFYEFMNFAKNRGMQMPPEVLGENGALRRSAPWGSKAEMDADPGRVNALRTWLARPEVQDMQLSYTQDRLARMANGLDPRARTAYENIVAHGATDLLVDLVNFKGEGAVRGMLERYNFPADTRRGVADAAWQTLQATRSSEHLALYGRGWKNRLNGYWQG